MITLRVAREVAEFAKAVEEGGGRALVVDRALADAAAGREPSRYDLLVLGVESSRLSTLLSRAYGGKRPRGRTAFVTADGRDVVVIAPPCRPGRPRARARALPRIWLEDALRRRVFSVERLFYDPLSGALEDPAGASDHVAAGRLVAVEEPVELDATAPFRAAELAAEWSLVPDDRTASRLSRVVSAVVPPHRVWRALETVLLDAERPSVGLEALARTGGLEALAPELAALEGVPEDRAAHPEGDAWAHTKLACDEARLAGSLLPTERRLVLAVAALFHDAGKVDTVALVGDRVASGGHEVAGASVAARALERLHARTHLGVEGARSVVALVERHLLPRQFAASGAATLAHFERQLAGVDRELLYLLALADGLGRAEPARDPSAAEWFGDRLDEAAAPAEAPGRLLAGSELVALGVAPGARARAVADEVFRLQREDGLAGRGDALREAARLASSSAVHGSERRLTDGENQK